eukprot:CAMPEP_0179328508 /NCGR_PEP_ID=MMETSP0797-20121207/62568_1 /TAXON_ID=47934 /ORGANISM="Dinophysis acuminata, Strain DAEP01" /LENGTH=182 /DNA_ID=CAMNT_0021040975 /DNA_START=37 /DNA_END=586 /DNA_ORIENTATION=+
MSFPRTSLKSLVALGFLAHGLVGAPPQDGQPTQEAEHGALDEVELLQAEVLMGAEHLEGMSAVVKGASEPSCSRLFGIRTDELHCQGMKMRTRAAESVRETEDSAISVLSIVRCLFDVFLGLTVIMHALGPAARRVCSDAPNAMSDMGAKDAAQACKTMKPLQSDANMSSHAGFMIAWDCFT